MNPDLIKRLQDEGITIRKMQVKVSSYDEKARTFRVVASTETPVEIFDWERWDFVNEVLTSSGFELRSGEQTPLLDSHSRFSVSDVLGSARNWTSTSGAVESDIFLASTEDARNAEIKIREGHITDVSVGYRRMESVFIPDKERQTVNGKEYAGPIRVTTKWMVHELSLVPIGADAFAKVRSAGRPATAEDTHEYINRIAKEYITSLTTTQRGGTTMKDEITTNDPPKLTLEELQKREKERVDEIQAVAKRFEGRVPEINRNAKDAIDLGISAEQFKGDVFTRVADGQPIDSPKSFLDLSAKDKRRYSLHRLIASQIPAGMGGRPDVFNASFEKECSEEIAKRTGRNPQGMFIPYDIDAHMTRLMQRDLTVGSATAGGNLVGTAYLPGSFIELLYGKMLTRQLGVQYLPGLTENIAIPKQLTGSTWYWVAEQSAITQGDPTYGQVTLSPKTGGARTAFSRKLLLQANPAIEGLVQTDLSLTGALGIDKAIYHGSGSANQPQGIIGSSGVASVTGTSFVDATAIAYETAVAAANGEVGSMAFVTTPTIRGALKGRLITPTYGSEKIWAKDNTMNGYPAFVSTQITAGYVLFGVWNQVLVGEWGGIDVLVDPYTLSTQGDVKVTLFISIDVALRHGVAFAASTTFS